VANGDNCNYRVCCSRILGDISMAKRGLITGGGGDGVDSYIDLENLISSVFIYIA
jgi:alkyl hydroperoxide reductase subunit AhpF